MTNPNHDWIGLARDAFSASSGYFDSSIRTQIEADLRQFQGLHPSGSKYLDQSRQKSRLFRPKTRAVIRKNEAAAAEAFFSTRDVVTISPENDNDPVQQASAAVMSELLQYRLSKTLPWFLTAIGAYQDAQTVGVVCSYQYWEYNEKKKIDRPNVRLVPIENLRFDPAASWVDPVNTSPYFIELIPMYVAQVKSRMRTPDPKTGAPKWRTLDESVILQATKSYGDSIRLQREGPQRQDSKYPTQSTNAYNIVWVHKNIIEVDDVDYCYYTLGADYLLSDPVPLETMYFHGRRPYVIGQCIIETHKNYPASVPRLTKDVQSEINEIANQRQDNIKLVLNKRYFAKRNKQVDLRSLTRNVPGSVTLMNDIDDVKPVEFNDITNSAYKEQEVLNLDFDDIAGAFSGSSVQSNRKLNETVGGMRMLDTNANQVSGYQLRTFVETWVEPVLRQIVLLEQYYETDTTLIGLCGQTAMVAQKFGVNAITDQMLMSEFTLSVNVGLGAVSPTDQLKQFLDGMTALRDLLADGTLEKHGLKVEQVVKELFGKLGYKDGARFFEMGDNPMVQQLNATIADLQSQLQAKMPKELLQATVEKIHAEIDKIKAGEKQTTAQAVKTGVEAQFSAMQSAEVIAAVPQVAPIADKLMEAAGYTVPVPPGVDPNFPMGTAAADGIGIDAVKNRRTGMSFTPGLPPGVNPPPQNAETTVESPTPATPGLGVRHGIETVRPDSAGPALANGGMIARYAHGGQVYGYADGGLLGQPPNNPFVAPVVQVPAPVAQPVVRPAPEPVDELPLAKPPEELAPAVRSARVALDYGGLGGSAVQQSMLESMFNNPYGSAMGVGRTFAGLDSYANGGRVRCYADGGEIAGLIEPGNIDLNTRPIVPNADGSISTVRSASFNFDGREVLIPTVAADGSRLLSDDEAVQQYRQSGQHLGIFDTPDNATAYAQRLHEDQARLYAPHDEQQRTIAGYASGGLIQGPGTGTSDSIPAVAAGSPAAVSNGEYLVPAAVVQALGVDFFNTLLQQFHAPVQQPGAAPTASVPPVAMDNGDFIVPADVVQALGRDFFDQLVQRFGGAA